MSRVSLSLSQIEKSTFPLESIAWLLSDLCLKNEAYAVCRELVPSRGLRRIFAGASSFACLMWDVCLKNVKYTVCWKLPPSSGLV